MAKNENEKVQAPAPAPLVKAKEVEKVDFDTWFAMRQAKIARQHHKEIIQADFKARGVKDSESVADFDAALRKYGVKLD